MTKPLLECRFEDLGPNRGYRLVSVERYALLDVPVEWLPGSRSEILSRVMASGD